MADLEHAVTKRLRAEVDPPRGVTCPFCEGTSTRFVYSTPYPEAGVRRVNHQCTNERCRAMLWWDEDLQKDS